MPANVTYNYTCDLCSRNGTSDDSLGYLWTKMSVDMKNNINELAKMVYVCPDCSTRISGFLELNKKHNKEK